MSLQEILHVSNAYIKSLKAEIEKAPTAEFRVVIKTDERPSNEHARRFNLPQCNVDAIIVTDENFGKKDIVLKSIDSTLTRV